MRLSTPSQPSTCAPSSLPSAGVEEHLEEQRRGARVVGRVAVVVRVDLAVLDACRAQLRLGHAGAARGHVEHLDHGGALGAAVGAVATGDRVGGDAALPVRRAGQHRERGLAGQQVGGLHRVAGGEDVRVPRCASARRPRCPRAGRSRGRRRGRGRRSGAPRPPSRRRRPRPTCRRRGRARAGRRRSVGGPPWPTCRAAGPRRGCGRGSQDPGHLGVEPRHEPLGPLDDGGPQPARPEGLGELQADVAAADDDGARGALLELGDDAVHVGDVAQHVDARVVGTRDRRPDRLGARAEHELVVGLPVRSPLPRGRAPRPPWRRGRCGAPPVRSARRARGSWPGSPASAAAGCPGPGWRRRCGRAGRSWRTRRSGPARA